jgi:hypothetical protein
MRVFPNSLCLALPVVLVCGCGARTTLDEAGAASDEGVACGDDRCGGGLACAYCPGESARCVPPVATGILCPGAMIVECDDPSDCEAGNQCTFQLGGTMAYARCTSLDLACAEPPCSRVCASNAECYPGEVCEPAVLKYGAIDVCR